jgi:3-dehydroquinate synthase
LDTLSVALGERSYPILIGPNLLGDGVLLREQIRADHILIITNEVVAPLYLDQVERGLADRTVTTLVLPDGEAQKSLATFARIMDTLVARRFHRDSCIVALGGGVIGDLAGFAAACYQRGIAFVQIPTTLLAQVDSSVGGKTAVNHPGGKNLIGAFYQPRCVIADTDTLKTLPPREFAAGLAEVIKYGLILDAAFFAWLENHIAALQQQDDRALATAIRRSCEIKAAIVAEDEREAGRRALLNLGHTFGHALEVAAGYGNWLHGEAVAVGLLLAARYSQYNCGLAADVVPRIETLLKAIGLPTAIEGFAADTLLDLMTMDKKSAGGQLRLVVMAAIGESMVISAPSQARLAQLLREYGAS